MQFNRKHDTILWYSKSEEWVFNFNEVVIPYTKEQAERFSEWDEEKKNWYYWNKIPEVKKLKHLKNLV